MAGFRYISFVDPATGLARMGNLNDDGTIIQPLSFISGTPISSLYQVIEAGDENIAISGEPLSVPEIKILAPITGRDILAVGKNYSEHAKEFNGSGYDSSDKFDIPSHPVIFTKRATSIIANGEEIYSHPGFTETVDYEGEIGVIVGKAGFRISEEDAMNHVWGYTIINDMTARERQRDHKQFYIGKSPDTFCPMGPVAVPLKQLPEVLRLQTHVNGDLKQNATTEDLIFSIPFLIKTLSEGQTLRPGDVIATGTPAGVGIGKKPPVFLKPGDEITISVTGLGSLTNRITCEGANNDTLRKVEDESSIPTTNLSKTINGIGLANINNKPLYYQNIGSGEDSIILIHGLGGTTECWYPLISTLSLEKSHSLHLFDLEGHGISPTSPLSVLSMASFADDLKGIYEHAGISSATIIAHSLGSLVALTFSIAHPQLVKRLILLGPPPSPLPDAFIGMLISRAATVRTKGMASIVDFNYKPSISQKVRDTNPIVTAALRLVMMGQDPEGYAKACSALAGVKSALEVERLNVETLIITGDEDEISSPEVCQQYAKLMKAREPVILNGVGHWHMFEDVTGVASAIKTFLSRNVTVL